MRKILRGAVVLLIAIAMVFSTVAIADTNEEQVLITKAGIKTTNFIQSVPIVEPGFGPTIFSQPPPEEDDPWGFYSSASNLGYLCIDDYWELDDVIWDVHWWGISLLWNDGWYECDPTGMAFEIIIYDSFMNPVCTYTDLTPVAQPTGKFFSGFEMYKWEVDLAFGCGIVNGWISIQSIYSPNSCSFLWANSLTGNSNAEQNGASLSDNLAFELTKKDDPVPPTAPTIDGPPDGNPGVEYGFIFHSFDENGDMIRYHIDWGDGSTEITDWYPACTNVTVYHTYAEKGTYKITAYAEDETGLVSDTTIFTIVIPRSKAIANPVLKLLQTHPNLFPLLQKLLVRFGL